MSGRVSAFASMVHYVDHLAPVWRALDPRVRADFVVSSDRRVRDRARAYGIQPTYGGSPSRHLTIVAGAPDLAFPRRAVLLEHGAGQTYGINHPSWAGGRKRDRVVLFVVPNGRAGEANLCSYPDAEILIAAPRVEWLRHRQSRAADWQRLVLDPRIVVSRRWDSILVPELRSAWNYYRDAIQACAQDLAATARYGAPIALHAHPRALADQRRLARRWDVELIEQIDDVYARAAVYVADNSSTLYEAAALGIPTVLLNHPDWRRDVHHGLRFWDCLPGPQIDEPAQLPDALWEAWLDDPYWQAQRKVVTAEVFPVIDGSAALAARAIEALA